MLKSITQKFAFCSPMPWPPGEMVKSPLMAESPERRFDEAMHDLYGRIVRACGGKYRPTIFHDMLETLGGLETAHRLLRPDADFFSYGFQKLCEMKKADLTMEAMILDLDYAGLLFTPEELRTANERLQAAQQMF
jgi:hypothetical protein